MLPVLLFETMWKLVWLGLVALPNAETGTLDQAMTDVLVNCSLVILIIAVTPWRSVWARFVLSPGERWR
jgi:hypothetical protein